MGNKPPLSDASEPRPLATVPRPKPQRLSLSQIQLRVEREGGAQVERAIVLDGDFVRIGTHSSNDLVLGDRAVSCFHCTLQRSGAQFRVTDLDSTNGTFIEGMRVRDADITPDCRIDVGDSSVVIRAAETFSETEIPEMTSLGALYGASVPMRMLFDMLRRIAKSSSDVLIEGENGTGKELIATEIVQRSARAKKPLVVVDCGAISPSLVESELFGHARGAFTHASRDRAGALEEADGGTVFLDEIGELPLEMQPKLLRALASREVRRVGENQVRKIDIRVLVATNRHLAREVNNERFRADLYHRLSVVSVRVPPLRERKEDIPLLVQRFLQQLDATSKAYLFPPEVIDELTRYDWPGNVRELRNQVERRLALGADAPFAARDDRDDGAAAPPLPACDIEVPFKEAKEAVIVAFEHNYLASLLGWAGGNVSRAARKAQLDRMHLHKLLQRYGMRRAGPLE